MPAAPAPGTGPLEDARNSSRPAWGPSGMQERQRRAWPTSGPIRDGLAAVGASVEAQPAICRPIGVPAMPFRCERKESEQAHWHAPSS
jgi:hypothetical protein